MPISLLQHLILISLFSSIISLTNFCHAHNLCQNNQKTLLLELKNNLIFNSFVSTKLVKWNQTGDCCDWKGVGCDEAGHVVILKLDSEGISGGIEDSSSFVSLEFLEKLSLANNSLNGTIPILNHPSLIELDLSRNQLKGPIPDSFFNLESLEVLSLANNLFNDTSELENLHKLHNLTTLNLSYNDNLTLDASSLSSNWSRFSHLKKLSLSSCNLHKIPDFLKQSNLTFLDLSDNWLTGEIPNWIWEIGNGDLYHLNLSYNMLVHLQKPYHIPNFLAELDLHSNQLRGELPLLPEGASYADFSHNKFHSPIPLNFVSFNFVLIFLSIANNSISGSIPTCICSAESTQVLDLSLNNLSDSIPPCLVERMYSLRVLNLRRNNISGAIPDKFPSNCGMKILDLGSNKLGGKFPRSLGNCTSLWSLNVEQNYIEGSFPCMLPRLKVLVLRSNRLEGEIKCGDNWPYLQIIDISSNNFSGDLHHISFSTWNPMMLEEPLRFRHRVLGLNVVRPDFNYLTHLKLTVKGIQVEIIKIWPDFTSIDFSCNSFEGEIPEAIGDLTSLYLLNLSHNSLTGPIPKSFGNMEDLEALDLSVNQLTNTIPVEIAQLNWLSVLNLSYNNLVGRIPDGRQLRTFFSDSYIGNTDLCGFPLKMNCSMDSGNVIRHKIASKSRPRLHHNKLRHIFFILFDVAYLLL